jgi:O-acetylhomoserine (thiol)-lyase
MRRNCRIFETTSKSKMGQLCRLKRPSTAWLAQKYVKGKPSAILSFGVQDGREGGTRFIDALQLFTRLVNIGDAKFGLPPCNHNSSPTQ